MTLANSTIGLIRSFFNQSRGIPQPEQMNTLIWQSMYPQYGGTAGGGIGPLAEGNPTMQNALNINNDLLSKYADYQDMSFYPECFSALNFWADESTQNHVIENHSVWINSDNEQIKDILTHTFHKQLLIENQLWQIARNIAKYGNTFKEIVVQDGVGIVKLIGRRSQYMRRIQDNSGNLFGYLEDPTMAFKITTEEFLERLYYGSVNLSNHSADQQNKDQMKVYEPWEICHWRLDGDDGDDLYGHCLVSDTLITTNRGNIPISNVIPGDKVLSYHLGKFQWTNVKQTICNGFRKTLTIKTRSRQIRCTGNHPILTDRSWVNAEKLLIGDRIKIIDNNIIEEFDDKLFLDNILSKAYTNVSHIDNENTPIRIKGDVLLKLKEITKPYGLGGKPNENSRNYKLREAGFNECETKSISEFFRGDSALSKNKAEKALAVFGIQLSDCDPYYMYNRDAKPFSIDDISALEFASLFGYMIGDGWIIEGNKNKNSGIGIALKKRDPNRSKKYDEILCKFKIDVSYVIQNGIKRQANLRNQRIAKMFLNLGFIHGAHNKRIPGWVYQCSYDIRLAFFEGLMDSDGWKSNQHGYDHVHFEMCNELLVKDIKLLSESLGYKCGKVGYRTRKCSLSSKDTNAFHHMYYIVIRRDSYINYDEIVDISQSIDENVWDLEIDHDSHCFLADGMVVHNSSLEGARWAWKRLQMMEDALLLGKLTKSPQRYVYYVDVGDVPPNEARKILNTVKQEFQKQKMIDNSGKINWRYNPLSQSDDIFIARRKDKRSTEIEVLSGIDAQSIADTDYFKNKLISSLGITKSYLGYDETIGRANLGTQDLRMARSTLRLQKCIKMGLRQIADVDLSARNIDPHSVDYEICMTVPSGALELAHIEVAKAKAELCQLYQGLNIPDYYLWSKVLGMSDGEIDMMEMMRSASPAPQNPGELGSGGGGSELPSETPPEAAQETPPEETSSETPKEAPQGLAASKYRRIPKDKQIVDSRHIEVLNRILATDNNVSKRINEVKYLINDIKANLPRRKY